MTPVMTFAALAEAASGQVASGDPASGFGNVRVDSRLCEEGSLFAALSGERADGHDFLADAFSRGAAGALIKEEKKAPCLAAAGKFSPAPAIVSCEDPQTGLLRAAEVYLRQFPHLRRVALTGSNGKTTTKELAAAMLAAEMGSSAVFANEGNLNSLSGLPMEVFRVRAEHKVCVFELGTNSPGEIAALAEVVRPHIALITNVGSAHIGIFGTKSNLLEEKINIFKFLEAPRVGLVDLELGVGKWEVGSVSENLSNSSEISRKPEGLSQKTLFPISYFLFPYSGTLLFYDSPYDFPQIKAVRNLGLGGWEVEVGGVKVVYPLPGQHNLQNARAAAAIARSAGAGDEAVRAGLAAAKPLFGRNEVYTASLPCGGSVTVVRDCYNSSPESAASLISLCDSVGNALSGEQIKRKIYVFGSMLELGSQSRAFHEYLGASLAGSKADIVFLYGEEAKAAFGRLETARGKTVSFFPSMADLREHLASELRDGDLVVLKASRGCGLERALDGVFEAEGEGNRVP